MTSEATTPSSNGEVDEELLFVHPRVVWVDGADSAWDRIYTVGGGSLRSVDVDEHADLGSGRRRIEQTFMAIYPPTTFSQGPGRTDQVTGTLRKILQRGDAPPVDPDVESRLLTDAGLTVLADAQIPGDLTVGIGDTRQLPLPEDFIAAAQWGADDFVPIHHEFDSDEEDIFYSKVLDEFGPHVARWVYPQASLDLLLEGRGGERQGFRRVDFLYAPPWSDSTVIEIDGLQHQASTAVDAARDSSLNAVGIEVVRIPASVVRDEELSSIENLASILKPPPDLLPESDALRLLHGPATITRFGLALAEALDRGWVVGAGDWNIDIDDPINVVEVGAQSILELLGAIDELWVGHLAPNSVRIRFSASGRQMSFTRTGIATYAVSEFETDSEPDFTVRFELDRSSMEWLGDQPASPTIVFRASMLPVRLAEPRSEGARPAVAQDPEAIGTSLQRLLRYIFAKKEFREGQEEAIRHILQGGETVVLLPTGAGKSLIYQLVGLLLPGRTLIIDPIVALIEDQVASLRRYGIDRAVGLSSAVWRAGKGDQALDLVKRGDALFFFVSPERLQQQGFRKSLRALTTTTPINLAVVDEAHCVSEWGHDFRPAYLGLGSTIRTHTVARDGSVPPLLALTGTASRAVLRDVLVELDLDRAANTLIVKPQSFDRPELSFDVIKVAPGTKHDSLAGYMRGLPQEWGMTPERFFSTTGQIGLGIVFCPHVNGEFGIVEVAQTILKTGLIDTVGMYAGTAPRGFTDWESQKRRNARDFREGRISVLATTKAFGMGIDIPNIRYTIHFGLPGSIESFYQEAGRAGRDRLESRCAVIFSEASPEQTRELLGDEIAASQAHTKYSQVSEERVDDDVVRQLFFHFNSFPGTGEEAAELDSLLELLDQDGMGQLSVPFGSDEKGRERSIYRLKQVGLVGDYLKDWGSRSFEVRLSSPSTDDLDASFLAFADRAQPGQSEHWRQRVAILADDLTVRDRARALSLHLIDLLYDTIERSRRRALRELIAMMRDSRGNQEIRDRIEDYFREGDIAPVFESLLGADRMDISAWLAALTGLSIDDAGELRGTTARLLESYPDHPGLLSGRAYAELLAHGDAYEFEESLGRAIETAGSVYTLEPEEIADMEAWFIDRCTQHNMDWAPIVWELDSQLLDSTGLVSRESAVLEAPNRPGESIMVMDRHLARTREMLDELAGLWR